MLPVQKTMLAIAANNYLDNAICIAVNYYDINYQLFWWIE